MRTGFTFRLTSYLVAVKFNVWLKLIPIDISGQTFDNTAIWFLVTRQQ